MKLKKNILLMTTMGIGSLVLLPAMIACGSTETAKPVPIDKPAPIEKQKVLDMETKLAYLANVWNTQSAEKDAMALSEFKSAKKAFDFMKMQDSLEITKVTKPLDGKKYMQVSNPPDGKYIPVVFMDLDETVLNNYAFQNWTLLNKTPYSSALWREFVDAKVSTEIKGAFDFIRHVWNNGGVVLYNSNRNQDQWQATKENMMSLGLEEQYLPDYSAWMSGVNLKNAKPWSETLKDAKGKIVKSQKEDRMNLVSSGQVFDLSDHEGGSAVKFRTIMRIGDNFDDFNDNASKGKLNSERVKLLDKIGKLFGNFDTSIKGLKFTKGENGTIVETNEEWSESYFMLGGNVSYGGFEEGIKAKWFSLSGSEQEQALKTVLNGLVWAGPKAK